MIRNHNHCNFIPAGGSITVNVGATLAVTSGVSAGEYIGAYTIIINY